MIQPLETRGQGHGALPRPCDRLVTKLSAVADLSEDSQEAVHALCHDARTLPARHEIIAEGERPDHVHVMVEGWAARIKIVPNGGRQITAFLLPGDFCDLHVTILGAMDHSIVALTDAKIGYVPHRKMEELPLGRPELARALWWATLVDEAVLRSWIVNIGRRDALQRVGHLFCELHARLRLVDLADADSFALPLTQEVLADALGLTSVHVNRTLQAMRSAGLIELSERVLTILDIPRLQKVSGFDPTYLHRGKLGRR